MSSLCQQNTSEISLYDTPADAQEQVLLSACRPPRWQEVPVIVLRFHVTVLFEQLHEFETHTQKTNYNVGIFLKLERGLSFINATYFKKAFRWQEINWSGRWRWRLEIWGSLRTWVKTSIRRSWTFLSSFSTILLKNFQSAVIRVCSHIHLFLLLHMMSSPVLAFYIYSNCSLLYLCNIWSRVRNIPRKALSCQILMLFYNPHLRLLWQAEADKSSRPSIHLRKSSNWRQPSSTYIHWVKTCFLGHLLGNKSLLIS